MRRHKRTFSRDSKEAAYLAQRGKRFTRNVSAARAVAAEAVQIEARDEALAELGEGVPIDDRSVKRWLKKLGSARRARRSRRANDGR